MLGQKRLSRIWEGPDRSGLGPSLFVNGVLLGGIALLALLNERDRSLYYRLVQEDGVIESMTVLAALLAMVLALVRAHRWYRGLKRFPWFYAGLALFCLFFVGEELSWGQRRFSYGPPVYFFEYNTQQELNFHNLFKHILRTKYLLMAILLGYGMLLPAVVHLSGSLRNMMDRVGVLTPPLALLPGCVATFALLLSYPCKYTGEVAEYLLTLWFSIT